MSVSKTRAMLVEVARQLFAQNGVADTTMNDIAAASQKGRRTLYTYFRNKEEIYMACVESELQIVTTTLQSVMKQNLEPEAKLEAFIRAHFNVFKDMVIRNGSLHAELFKDITEIEKLRRKMDKKEAVMLAQILKSGNEKDVFEVKDIRKTAQIMQYALKGMEVPYIRENIRNRHEQSQFIYDLLFNGLKKKNN
ncbi:MAG: TetR/AcrR family transcriptional regulator [Bacteroidales bacterium]|jgi:AcrR family transcriptional regulator|nr:TetR/AcrR family transcriptional regulator [Bacteroidales bacterium]MDD3908128.1 TetR/AcrR family transcriptional regulator [Bacteroidales bacterium]MDD4713610.1 TetR/AcrR family transcriptional regulator [Bacteroidales bacterium]